jgi:hypothetical protein
MKLITMQFSPASYCFLRNWTNYNLKGFFSVCSPECICQLLASFQLLSVAMSRSFAFRLSIPQNGLHHPLSPPQNTGPGNNLKGDTLDGRQLIACKTLARVHFESEEQPMNKFRKNLVRAHFFQLILGVFGIPLFFGTYRICNIYTNKSDNVAHQQSRSRTSCTFKTAPAN